MGRTGAFLEVERRAHGMRDAANAIRDFDDIVIPLDAGNQRLQASRCMACGVAFCQSGMVFAGARRPTGCPLHNLIPETNDLVYRGQWARAAGRLALTNPLPEFTGRVCPAPCETACNLGLHDQPVTIHDNERAISDWAWDNGAVQPLPPAAADAPRVAVVGSGPAGLACAWELARLGCHVTVFEKADRPGGLLMYGIPSMKLPKDIVLRRIELMRASGIAFVCGNDAAEALPAAGRGLAAIVIAAGAGKARRMDVPGAQLPGVTYALDYLRAATVSLLDGSAPAVSAAGKDVVVLGGGDTGTDCVATAVRQGARSVTQVIRAQKPPVSVDVFDVWPAPRTVFTADYGQRDAAFAYGSDPRVWSTDTIAFEGDEAVEGVRLQDLAYEGGRHAVEGSQRTIPAQLVVVAKGFTGPEAKVLDVLGVPTEGGLPLVAGGGHRAVRRAGADAGVPVYVAGDARTGSSLVSSAIADALACVRDMCADGVVAASGQNLRS